MALTVFEVGDKHPSDEWNCRRMTPKSGYTPVKGHIVVRDLTIANGFDVCAANELPYGEVIAVDPSTVPLYATIFIFVQGVTRIFPTSGAVAKGDKIEADGTALAVVGTGASDSRGVIRTDNTNGIGYVIAAGAGESPAGANTAVVEFL